jgi:nucleotide-binding universal stress UspA family protein
MPQITTVLAPIDFSDSSVHALEYATALATWYGARLVGVHAYTPVFLPVPAFATAGYGGPPMPDADMIKQMEQEVWDAMDEARAAGLKTEVRVVAGPAQVVILGCARRLSADAIVMGTHGAGGFEHLMLGSVAEKVLRKATCPVMTVPPRARATSTLPFSHVLCPVDFSDPSRAALQFALSIAQRANAELTILHVLDWPTEVEPAAHRAFSVPEYNRLREQDAEAGLAQLVTQSARDGHTVKTVLAHGKPYREILDVGTRLGVDLIVMGVQGRNALDVMLFGSTTNQVVRMATCPVFTCRQ